MPMYLDLALLFTLLLGALQRQLTPAIDYDLKTQKTLLLLLPLLLVMLVVKKRFSHLCFLWLSNILCRWIWDWICSNRIINDWICLNNWIKVNN